MPAVQAAPLLLGVLVTSLLALMIWGFLQCCARETGPALMGTHDEIMLGLLVLAALSLGVFLIYVVLR